MLGKVSISFHFYKQFVETIHTHTKQKRKAVPSAWKHIIIKTGETLEVKENWSEQGYEHRGNETLQNITKARKKCKCFLFVYTRENTTDAAEANLT
jgi:hypothetical protein